MKRSLAPPPPSDAEASGAPWMTVAIGELAKGVHEIKPADFRRHLYLTLSANTPKGPTLLDWREIDRQLVASTHKIDAVIMQTSNPSIAGYLNTVRTDPGLDARNRSFSLDQVRNTDSGWRMTAWCAAFVNWCLSKVNAPHLGFATAKSWLKFGVTLAHPRYGCVVVIKPSSATSSTTGHVAFYGGTEGNHVWLLGGNQHQSVSWMKANKTNVLGYRWPTIAGDFPLPRNVSSLA